MQASDNMDALEQTELIDHVLCEDAGEPTGYFDPILFVGT